MKNLVCAIVGVLKTRSLPFSGHEVRLNCAALFTNSLDTKEKSASLLTTCSTATRIALWLWGTCHIINSYTGLSQEWPLKSEHMLLSCLWHFLSWRGLWDPLVAFNKSMLLSCINNIYWWTTIGMSQFYCFTILICGHCVH